MTGSKYLQIPEQLNSLSKLGKVELFKNIIMSSFKSSENIKKKDFGPDRSVSDNRSSSVTLNELA